MSLFTAARILLLLFIYDVAFIYISILFENDFEVCMSHAILTTLIVLGVLVLIRTVERIVVVKVETYHAEESIREKFRNEYRKVHKQRLRDNLISDFVCPNKKRILTDDGEFINSPSSDFRLIQINYNKNTR